jgi:hypothetical protein
MKYSPLSVFLRNLLVRKHFWFSCCASCGEIKTPLGNRLCASLAADFPVDALVLAASSEEATLRAIRKANPWLRKVSALAGAPAENLPDMQPDLVHTLPGLAGCFLMARSAADLTSPLHVLDFFTPNGLPLIALSRLEEPGFFSAKDPPQGSAVPAAPDLYAHSLENAELFLPLFRAIREDRGESEDPYALYAAALAHWAYREGRGVLVR